MANPAGRPRAIPFRLIPELLQQREQGKSWGELARWLRNTCAVDCSPGQYVGLAYGSECTVKLS